MASAPPVLASAASAGSGIAVGVAVTAAAGDETVLVDEVGEVGVAAVGLLRYT